MPQIDFENFVLPLTEPIVPKIWQKPQNTQNIILYYKFSRVTLDIWQTIAKSTC